MHWGFKMAEYSRMAKGSFTAAAAQAYVYLPFVPDYVELQNYTNMAAGAAASQVTQAWWDTALSVGGNNPTLLRGYTAGSVLADDVIATNGISSFSAGLALQFGAAQQVVGITKAASGVVTVTGHGYQTGDIVILYGLYQSSTTGMPQIDGIPFAITVTSANAFSIPWNTNQSEYTALSGSPTGAMVKKVLYPFLYAPGVSYIASITTGSTTTINTSAPHNLSVGSEVAFRIPSSWGTTELNTLPNSLTPGAPAYGYVQSVTDSDTVVVSINSSSYTAFDSNQPFANVSGQSFAQMVAVGDINSGGAAYSGGALYPPPSVNSVNTINGPAINGAFVNNTRNGFYIGSGAATNDTNSALIEANDVVLWRAYVHDYVNP